VNTELVAARYEVVKDPYAHWSRPFRIVDLEMGREYCKLPDTFGELQPLRFENAKAARTWLAMGGHTPGEGEWSVTE
jgi:hypothetical protein